MAELKIKADSGGGTVSWKGPATTTGNAAFQLTLPVDDGAADQYLKTNGSGVLSWATVDTSIADDSIVEAKLDIHAAPSGTDKFLGYTSNGMEWAAVPASGISEVDLWRLTSTFSGGAAPISSNLQRANGNRGFAKLGTGMTEASGVFSFPSTGHWRVTFNAGWYYSSASSNAAAEIQYTPDDGSNWHYAARGQTHIEDWSSYNVYTQTHVEHHIDVTDTSNQKVRFIVAEHESPNLEGNSNENRTYFTFIKLADT